VDAEYVREESMDIDGEKSNTEFFGDRERDPSLSAEEKFTLQRRVYWTEN